MHVLGLIGFFLIPVARGWPTYNDLIPNGDKVPNPCNPSLIWNGVGHLGPYGSGPRNQFGHDFIKANKVGEIILNNYMFNWNIPPLSDGSEFESCEWSDSPGYSVLARVLWSVTSLLQSLSMVISVRHYSSSSMNVLLHVHPERWQLMYR